MKTILRIILGLIELGASALFFVNGGSDIQLGFAITFLFLGLSAFISTLKR